MKSPITGKEMTLHKEERTINFRKEAFAVQYHYYFCDKSGAQFTDDRLDDLNLLQVHNQYRERHQLPFPDEIIDIRIQYGLSASKMSEVLGFGTNIYRQYELGEVPSASNGRLIQMCKDPQRFKELVLMSSALDGKPLLRCLAMIDGAIERKKQRFARMELELLGPDHPDSFSGFKQPKLILAAQMIAFFAENLKPWKTKLNKLLFYADCLHFKRHGVSISGMRYDAIQLGPVPHNFNSLYEFLNQSKWVRINFTEFENGGIGEQFFSMMPFDAELFEPSELESMRELPDAFLSLSTKEMIARSHEEKAWLATQENEDRRIDFLKYGFALSL